MVCSGVTSSKNRRKQVAHFECRRLEARISDVAQYICDSKIETCKPLAFKDPLKANQYQVEHRDT